MLACMVGIPALALSGTSWTDMLKKLQEFRWSSLLDVAATYASKVSAPTSTASSSEAPRFVPSGPAAAPLNTARGFAPLSSPVVPVGYQETSAAAPPVVHVAGASAAAMPAGDAFRAIQDRLQQMGATYYLLESWGTRQQMYRFYCKMAIGGSADYTRYFEATSDDPLQAMKQVLREVEAWREGKPQNAAGQ
jgi:hypothetical protein